MARSRRRPAPQQPATPHTASSAPVNHLDTKTSDGDDNLCPACSKATEEGSLDKENWIRCDGCKKWFHWGCAGNGTNVESIDQWFCSPCLGSDPRRVITLKPPTRKSVRRRAQRDYASLHSGTSSDPNRWARMLESKPIAGDPFKRMHGQDVRLRWLDEDADAMKEPIVIEQPDGLDMTMPPEGFTVMDVVGLLGEEHPVEVIDVATQSTSPNWTLGKWGHYFCEPATRDRILNVISLEISGSALAQSITPPKLVRELDWVENYWPSARKGKGHAYPKVQLYCLMGVATAWTDWHVDFAGSSVYYHILRGSKVFYFIRPSRSNLAAYERWSGTELQTHVWLGDMVDEVYKVELRAGNTMIIPSGWIHAVYTPEDTLVFGGNFLHSYDYPTQLRVCEIENVTQVPRKFRFPFFTKLCWYVGEHFVDQLKKASPALSPRVLTSVIALANFLVSEAHMIERGTDAKRKEAKENIPHDRVKDPSSLARELRWRARLAAGNYSDDEESEEHSPAARSSKRKRGSVGPRATEQSFPKFRNFKPKVWDRAQETPIESDVQLVKAVKPESDDWTSAWVEGEVETGNGDEVRLDCRRERVVKVRRTDTGIERHRVERVVERWEWC